VNEESSRKNLGLQNAHAVEFLEQQVRGRLTARGSFSLKQSDFGMVPVTAAGGTVRVEDEVDVQFVLRARPPDDTRTDR
jgi:hypothetical protein